MVSCSKIIVLIFFSAILASCGQTGGNAPSLLNCDGKLVGGACWYYGALNKSCDDVCTNHGGYNTATETDAGSVGTDDQCKSVLTAVGAPDDEFFTRGACPQGFGCMYDYSNSVRVRCAGPGAIPTTSAAKDTDVLRACACNN